MDTEARGRFARHGRWTVTAGVALVALGLLSLNASATFEAQVSPSHATDTGDMEIAVPSAGGEHRIATASADIVPGDTIERSIRLNVTANQGGTMEGIELTTSGSGNPDLVTDSSLGLKLWIALCDQAWDEAGSAPGYTYSCAGSEDDVLGTSGAPVDFEQAAVALGNVDISNGASNYLRVRISWPAGAAGAHEAMENVSTTLAFQFDGIQRAGTDK